MDLRINTHVACLAHLPCADNLRPLDELLVEKKLQKWFENLENEIW